MRYIVSLLTLALHALLFTQSVPAQTNHAPIFRSRSPLIAAFNVTQPVTFAVSAYDPDGDTLTYTWKIDGGIVQSGRDSSYVLTPAVYHQYIVVILTCVFADPGGLRDSSSWHVGPDMYVEPTALPTQPHLDQNYPNPFNPSTTISYDLPSTNWVTLGIYNSLGKLQALLVDEEQVAGLHEVHWSPALSSGVYFCRLWAGNFIHTRKMILLK